jgi:serine/threonine protein kinase
MSVDDGAIHHGSSGRQSRVEAIVDELLRQRDAGQPIDPGRVENAHPELMPELGERLRALESIADARRRALGELSAARPETDPRTWMDDDLAFLRQALPQYEVLERLRHGGQGVVYRARQRGANRPVAIKVLLDGPLATDAQRSRFEREIELISRLRHRNIVTLYDTGRVRGRHYFAMEFIDGIPIDDYVLLHDLSPRQVVRLFVKVGRAVSYAHQNGVIHRDLSPSNILVDADGEPHVFDFGLAKDEWAADDTPVYSFTGQVLGTLYYLSPEQAGGLDGKTDVRSDIYTLGVVLYELLVDELPYDTEGGPQQVREAIVNTPPTGLRRAARRGGTDRIRDPDFINRDLESVLAKALTKEKDERYQSAAAFTDDLERCLNGAAVAARVDNPVYLLRKALRRYRGPVIVASIVLATLGASAVAVTGLWFQARRERDNAREATRVAYDLFDTAVNELETAVRPLAGGVAVRQRMIAHLADRLPRLETLIESDAALETITTRLSEKQGDLAFDQGDYASAARKYGAFLESSQRLARRDGARERHADAVVRAYRKYAQVAEDPERVFAEAIDYAERVLARDPGRDEALFNLCQLRAGLGQHLFFADADEAALVQFDHALALCAAADPDSPRRIDWLRSEADTRNRRGVVLQRLGQGERAMAELASSLRLREQIAEARPADTTSRYDLMVAYTSVGRARRDAGDVDEARRLLRKAIEQGEFLHRMDPTVAEWTNDLYSSYDSLVHLLLDLEEPAAAKPLCERALELAEGIQGLGVEGVRLVGYAQMLRGTMLMATDEPEAAYAAYAAARDIRASLVEDGPLNLAYRDDLAVTYNRLGQTGRRLAQLDEATAHYRKSLALRRELLAAQPNVVKRTLDVIKVQINLSAALIYRETVDDDLLAKQILDDAERALEALHAHGTLVGLERTHQIYSAAIADNQRIVDERLSR